MLSWPPLSFRVVYIIYVKFPGSQMHICFITGLPAGIINAAQK